MRLLIGVPTARQSMVSYTAVAIAEVVRLLTERGITALVDNLDSHDVITARDVYASTVLERDFDALLFIDSDMDFDPELILRMIDRKADVVGVAYPRRSFDLQRFWAAAKQHDDYKRAVAEASNFCVQFAWSNDPVTVDIVDGFAPAAAVGTAVMLITKQAFQAMIDAGVATRRPDVPGGHSFFSRIEVPELQTLLGEDYSFCYRWTHMMKRELLVCVDEEIKHIGNYTYSSRYMDLFSSP